jgi:hypothetical protein
MVPIINNDFLEVDNCFNIPFISSLQAYHCTKIVYLIFNTRLVSKLDKTHSINMLSYPAICIFLT